MDGTHEKFSWGKRRRSFVYAWRGIRAIMLDAHNFRLHILAALMAVGAGIWLGISLQEWAIVALCIGVVTMAEGFNSAIETLCDKVSPEQDPKIGRCKDMAAGAVLLAAAGAAAAGIIIFLPKLINLLF